MEKITLENDIKVLCVTAKSFPDGVLEAHETLHGYIPFNTNRKYFGISYPDKSGTIIYKSAAEELDKGELSKHDLEVFMIKKGEYVFINIKDFRNNIPEIGKAFQMLIDNPDIDQMDVVLNGI